MQVYVLGTVRGVSLRERCIVLELYAETAEKTQLLLMYHYPQLRTVTAEAKRYRDAGIG